MNQTVTNTLFEVGDFTLHSDGHSNFRINCEALTDQDWDSLAQIINKKFTFGVVIGLSTGGIPLQRKLTDYLTPRSSLTLIVDDVYTTGKSMYRARQHTEGRVIGVVVFARTTTPSWVYPIFNLNPNWTSI